MTLNLNYIFISQKYLRNYFKTLQYILTFQISSPFFSLNFYACKVKILGIFFKKFFFLINFFILHFFPGLWRATVWRRSFSFSYELHGQVSNSCWYTPNKTAIIRGSVYVLGIQIKRNKPFNLRETGHLHRQIHNTGRTDGECRRCQNSTPGGGRVVPVSPVLGTCTPWETCL